MTFTARELDGARCAPLVAARKVSADAWTAALSNKKGVQVRTRAALLALDERTHPDRQWARTVCGECSIRLRCLEEGGVGKGLEVGLWGGLDERERRAMGRRST